MSLTTATVIVLASTCQPTVPAGVSFDLLVRRAAAHAIVESNLTQNSIHRNTNGTIDVGIMQVNSVNWSRLGLTPDRLFDLHANICAGMQVIAENYDVERRVSCRYNTGKPDCASDYPDRIAAAMAHLGNPTSTQARDNDLEIDDRPDFAGD